MQLPSALSSTTSKKKKKKKIRREKNSYIPENGTFQLKVKKILIFGNGTFQPYIYLIFYNENFRVQNKVCIFSHKKIFLYFAKENFVIFSKKRFSYIFGNETFQSQKNKTFQEVVFRAQKIRKTHYEKTFYISGNVIFQPQHQNLCYISGGKPQSSKNKQKICSEIISCLL